MLAKPSPPRFEVEIVIIIIIITIFLCVAFLYYSISVNFSGVWRRILLSRVLAISWRLHHIQWPPKYICTIQKASRRVAWKAFISNAFVSIFEWFALEIGSYVRTSYPSYWFIFISVGTFLKDTSIAVVAQTFQFSIRNWSEGISWRDSEVSDPLAWESCKNRRIYSILEWKTNPKMVYLSSPSMNFFIAYFFRFLR